ncbi:phosphoenolpyruvate--protein phosphotransferase [Salinifilum aidingensis]
MSRLRGVGVSPGIAAGPAVRVTEALGEPASGPSPADAEAEAARIRPAADAVAQQLFQRAARAEGDAKTVLETTAAMAMDPALLSQAEQRVHSGLPAARAVHDAAGGFTEALRSAGDYLAERVRDVQDVRDRIVAELLGTTPPGVPDLDRPSVLLARDLAPADTAALDPEHVLALVTEEGGPTSHTAILARSLGIPAVVAVRDLLITGGVGITVDGGTGEVVLSAEPVTTRAAERRSAAAWDGTGATADGHPVKVLANIGSAADARAAAEAGAEGVGLFRTEFCYLDASTEPDVATQRAAYAEALTPFAGKPVVVRTLDAGADKPLPFLDMGAEPNPALGVRGLRIAFDRPELLDRQLEAVAAAAADSGAEVSVMAPMVATPEEAAWFAERVRGGTGLRAGAMVEVPAAALYADELCRAVDFVSIGTNDLAQYLFAADRMTGALAELNDPWHPALLRLIERIAEAGQRLGTPVGVCGEAAADPRLAGVLTGLGVTSLSVAAAAVGGVGAELARHPLPAWQQTARRAVDAPDPRTARTAG